MEDAFKSARAKAHTMALTLDGESIPMFLTYRGVREAARDWKAFSSDAPFRVPIPSEEAERQVRQLPIESDPPLHTAYRALVTPFFRRPKKADYIACIDALVADLLADATQMPEIEVVRDFALPLQSRALAHLLGMPQSEAETWIGWGTHVFRDGADPAGRGRTLDDYLTEQISKASENADREDFFAALSRMEFQGRSLTLEEKLGFANLTFAGGRDTVIQTVASIIAYFAGRREELSRVAASSRSINLAVEEFVRVVSPLTHIGRVCPHGTVVGGHVVPPQGRVSLAWAAANYDPDIFDDPETLCLDRSPNPHVGFGSGIHNCLGAPQARAILRSLIRGLAAHTSFMVIRDAVPNVERHDHVSRTVGFERLVAALSA